MSLPLLLLAHLCFHSAQAQNTLSDDPTFSFPVPADVASTTQIDFNKNPAVPQWIWVAQPQNNQKITFEKNFTLLDAPSSAILYLASDDTLEFFLNGQKITPNDPNLKSKRVRRFDLSQKLLANQNNLISIIATHANGAAGLVARLDWADSAGNHQIFSSSAWSALENNTSHSATPIAPLEGNPWRNSGGLPSWPDYRNGDEFYLKHLPITPIAVKVISDDGARFENLESITHPDQNGNTNLNVVFKAAEKDVDPPSLLLDFGQEVAGTLEVESTSDTVIKISQGETENEALRDPWMNKTQATAHLKVKVAKNKATQSESSGFRYMYVTFLRQKGVKKITFKKMRAELSYYPVKYQGSFESSDPLLNKIWYTGAFTTHLCMQEDIWDAPKRDRRRWMGDMMVSGDLINNVFGDRFLMEQTFSRLRDEAQGEKADTELPIKNINEVPGYTYAWINQLASFQKHLGDTNYLLQQHDLLVSMLKFVENDLDQNGIFADRSNDWDFVDWSPGFAPPQNQPGHPPVIQSTPESKIATHLFLVKGLNDAVYLFHEMHDEVNAKKYADFAEKTKQIARSQFQNPHDFTFKDRRQFNAMAIFAGVANPSEWESIYQLSLKQGTPDWDKVMTPYFYNYLIYAQSMAGHTQEAMDFIRSYWGDMLKMGWHTWFEIYDPRWPKDDFHAKMDFDVPPGLENTNFISLSHAWSSGPTNWLTERVLGIRPIAVGFSKVDIAPDLANLTWVQGGVPTPRGILFARVDQVGTTRKVHLQLPTATEAHVFVLSPSARVDQVSVSAQKDENGKYFVVVQGPGSHEIE